MKYSISAKRVLHTLLAVNAAFALLHLLFLTAAYYYPLTPFMQTFADRFNVDAEVSIPTWFAQVLLFAAAMLAAYIGKARQLAKDAFAWYWFAMALVLLYISIDEGAGLHELAAEPVREALNISSGPFIFAWIIPAAVIVLLIVLLFLKFYLQLPKQTKMWLFFAAAIFVGSAVGMELVSGAYWTANDFVFDMRYSILNLIEEIFENVGSIIGIYALLQYLSQLPKTKIPPLRFEK